MNSRQRGKHYAMLVRRDGEKCAKCGAGPPKKKLVIHHIDNDNNNNDSKNLQLLCRRCNYLENPRREPLDNVCESVNERGAKKMKKKKIDPTLGTELEINRRKEPAFREYVKERIEKSLSGMEEEEDVVNAGAEIVSLSPVTTRRYIDKLCSSTGQYCRIQMKGKIVIKKKG